MRAGLPPVLFTAAAPGLGQHRAQDGSTNIRAPHREWLVLAQRPTLQAVATGKGRGVPAVPMGCAALSDSLDEDAQLLQAHVCPGPHADDADAQALRVCGAEEGEKVVGAWRREAQGTLAPGL